MVVCLLLINHSLISLRREFLHSIHTGSICIPSLITSEECVDLIREELLSGLQRIEIPIFVSCPLFKKRLLDTIQSLIQTYSSFSLIPCRQSQKTVDLIRQLLSMELNYVNVRHPDFIGVHMERVRVEATARVKKVRMIMEYEISN